MEITEQEAPAEGARAGVRNAPPAPGEASSEEPIGQRVLTGLTVMTSDGARLATDVFLPKPEGCWPVTVVRTPYNRSNLFLLRLAKTFNAVGMAVLLQDCRGRYGSTGTWDWRREAEDARTCLGWLPEQPWFDGAAVMVGLSISSLPMFQVAAGGLPPGVRLAALVNLMGVSDLHSLFYRDGALLLHWALPWCLQMGGSRQAPTAWRKVAYGSLWNTSSDLRAPESIDTALWKRVLGEPATSDYWSSGDALEGLGAVSLPSLHVSGWEDFTLDQTLRAYEAMPEQKTLVIGPWDHHNLPISLFQAVAGTQGPLLFQIAEWAASHARGADPEDGAAHFVVPGLGWVRCETYPPPQVDTQSHYLRRRDDAAAEGALTRSPQAGAGSAVFHHDPEDPVPTNGGCVWNALAINGLDAGTAEQSAIEARPDVLVYTGDPLAEDLWVVGRPVVELWVSASPQAADFSAKLVDVDRDGAAWSVSDGIVSFRGRSASPGPPPWRIEIELDAVALRFQAGHRLRLEIAGGNFPKYDCNPEAAEQTIHHGADRPSRLRLPAVPREALTTMPPLSAGRRPAPWGPAGPEPRRGLTERLGAILQKQFAKPSGALGLITRVILALSNRKLNRWSVDLLGLRPGHRVLEIGFGPGDALAAVARRVGEGQVVGLDHSRLIVDRARRRHRRWIRDGRMEVRQGSVTDLSQDLGSFDKILSVNSAYLWPDRVSCLSALRQRLRLGGSVLLTMQPRWLPDEVAVRREAVRLAAELRRAGFTDVQVSSKAARPVPAVFVRGRRPSLPPEPEAKQGGSSR